MYHCSSNRLIMTPTKMRPWPPGLMRVTGRGALPLSPPPVEPTACPKGCSADGVPEFEVKLAEEDIEFDMRLDVMDELDIKLEAEEELAIMLEPAVDGFDISTAVRNRTWPVCPCGLPAM